MNKKTAAFINAEVDRLAEKILSVQSLRQPGFNQRYDARSKKLCLQDVKYHLSYLAEAIEVSSLSLFLDFIVWVKDLLRLVSRAAPALFSRAVFYFFIRMLKH
jgi:hypothetical protein